MAKTISDAQALAILTELDHIPLRALRAKPELFEAIALLGGVARNEVAGDKWILSCDADSMVNMVKAIRMITNLGLKEAKDYYDGVGGHRRVVGGITEIEVFHNMSVLGTNLLIIAQAVPLCISVRIG